MKRHNEMQPIQTPFYYGWVVVMVAGLSVFFLDQFKRILFLYLLTIT